MNNKYEAVLIFSVLNKDEAAIAAMVEKFRALIEANGTVEGVDEWGKRRLAYLIDDEAEGYYAIYNFEANTEFPTELERVAKITEGVLRVMTIRK
jgi:small subunit ribosomal protein S6